MVKPPKHEATTNTEDLNLSPERVTTDDSAPLNQAGYYPSGNGDASDPDKSSPSNGGVPEHKEPGPYQDQSLQQPLSRVTSGLSSFDSVLYEKHQQENGGGYIDAKPVFGSISTSNVDYLDIANGPTMSAPIVDGKESVEFQIELHVVDLFSIHAAESQKTHDRNRHLRYQLIQNNSLIRHMRATAANVLRSSPSTTTINSRSSVESSTSGNSSNNGGSASTTPNPTLQANDVGPTITLAEVMDSLQYVMDYRLKGRQQPHLDIGLMRRLRDGLLVTMVHTRGKFLNKHLTDEAQMAYFLFGLFIEEVIEFQQCVGEKSASDLRRTLRLHDRFTDNGPESERFAFVTMIRLVLACLPPGHDWRDLVDEHEQKHMAPIVEQYGRLIDNDKSSYHMPVSGGVVYPPPSLYFDRTIGKLVAMFNTSIDRGLTTDQIPERCLHYGSNELPKPVRRPWWKVVWTQLTDVMIIMLCAAIVATAVDGEWKSSIVLAIVVVLNTIVGAWQEIKAGRALSALENLSTSRAQVIRDGTLQTIDANELVPGDLVELGEGESVPADLRLVSCAQLEIVESVLTGESVGVQKNPKEIKIRTRQLPLGDCKGNAFMSTLVSRGRGRGIVVRTGAKTEVGKISAAINRSSSKVRRTPIQRKLAKLGLWLVVLAVTLCAVVVICGVSWGREFVPIFITGISLAVSVIPEGLVAVTTVTMALGVRRMARRNALVRTLPAVETLGSVTVICSDKTGTLTEGKMGASELVDANGLVFEFTKSTSKDPNEGSIIRKGYALDEADLPPIKSQSDASLTEIEKHRSASSDMTLLSSALCNNSEVFFDSDDGEWKSIGDPTEVALMIAAQKGGIHQRALLFNRNSNESGLKQQTYPLLKPLTENAFDSDRKRMSTVFEVCWSDGHESLNHRPGKRCILVLAKGAPEEMLAKCTDYIGNYPGFLSGSGIDEAATYSAVEYAVNTLDKYSHQISSHYLRNIGKTCEQMAERGLRVLGLAAKVMYIDLDSSVDSEALGIDWAERSLVFSGLIGLLDPPRLGIIESIHQCQEAGIKVIMITGDHIATASAIAESIGILKPEITGMDRAISGAELDLLSDDATATLQPFPCVFARVSPEHKTKIVRVLQQLGHVTAMTGDGVNDAAAVKGADIGVAMGQNGTDITKQAADIVLTDDNFTTIVSAVEEGRRVFDNILKFIVYLLSCNTAEIILFIISSILNLDLPFTTIMILWANIIADIPPALSLGLEPPESNIMRRPPRNPKEGVLTKATTFILMTQALFMSLVTFAVFITAVLTPLGVKVLIDSSNTSPDTYVPSIFNQGDPEVNANDNQTPHIAGARSLAFGVLTILQLNQAFLSRSVEHSIFVTGIRSNVWMIGAVTISTVFYIMGTYVPGLNDWLELVPLSWLAWVIILAALVIQIAFSEILKSILRRWLWAKRTQNSTV